MGSWASSHLVGLSVFSLVTFCSVFVVSRDSVYIGHSEVGAVPSVSHVVGRLALTLVKYVFNFHSLSWAVCGFLLLFSSFRNPFPL